MSNAGNANYFVHKLLRARDWQHRPQLDAVCDWWRDGGRGVCALIGMGGAGKTAVAERFLRVLPSGLPEEPGVPKDSTLPTPHSVFVFSFYDAPNADAFFESLQMWLEDTPRLDTLLSIGQMLFMLQQRQGLIVLDGLERVQDDGRRGEFGRLHSPRLRGFLNQLAGGNFADLSALITSRFPLADLRDKNSRFFHPIPVNQIDVAAGVQLLKDRGVRGTDPQLEPIVEQCGFHALTVDFAGGYIAEYGEGDPATPLSLGTAEELREASEKDELDDDQREVLRQGYRFARIAEHYRNAMLQKDEAAMALLERICLFRLGVDSETLAAIFTGEKAVEVSGDVLARLDRTRLQGKLDWLVRMRIVEAIPGNPTRERGTKPDDDPSLTRRGTTSPSPLPPGPEPSYSIHPAVRDGFLSGISAGAAVAGHEAVRQGLEVSLGESPGKNPSDPATLDLLEEIAHHTLQSGHVREAWDIYWDRIGGGENLLWRLGAYERGERICRAFAGGQSPETVVSQYKHDAQASESKSSGDPETHSLALRAGHEDGSALRRMPFLDLPEATQATFINEWALYLKDLGRLAAAARCYELNIEMRMRQENWPNASIGNQNLCDVWLLSGRLSRLPQTDGGRTAAAGRRKEETDESLPPSSFVARPSAASPATSARLGASSAGALATADEALRLAERADDGDERRKAHAYRGHAVALGGQVANALVDFAAALSWLRKQQPESPERPLYGLTGLRHTQLLARLGRHDQAIRLTEENQQICTEFTGSTGHLWTWQCQLVLSSLSLAGSFSGSSSSGSSAALWTQARDWALARDAKEVLCWSCLVEAQHALAKIEQGRAGDVSPRVSDGETDTTNPSAHAEGASELSAASTALESGLKIARDCGYGLYHIDLLLERARLHLLQGNPQAALTDIETALGDESGQGGIPEDPETGQPELPAARHPACGYAWPIPFGLQLQAEALLLQGAQIIGEPNYKPRSRKTPPEARSLIKEAKSNLRKAMTRWKKLHDPEPERDDQNFKLNGKEYNYKAAETHRIITDLAAGVLTRYPLTLQAAPEPSITEDPMPEKTVSVFFSYAHEDEKYKDELIKHLSILKRQSVIDVWHDRMITAGNEWAGEIDKHLEEANIILLLVSADFLASDYCYDVEMKRAMERHDAKEARVIPIIVRTVDWKGAPFGKLQACPKDAKPVDEWPTKDGAFTDIAQGIRNAIENP